MSQGRLIPEERLSELRKDELPELLDSLLQLTGPDLPMRQAGLRRLIEAGHHRRSPLAAALLVRGAGERDLELRREFVVALAEVIAGTAASPEPVARWLRHSLNQLRRREIYALLQVAAAAPGHTGLVHLVLDQCSFSGATLLQILQDRKADIQIRVSAAHALAAIGYLDAAPAVATLLNRIASRLAGQEEMGFAPSLEAEADLLIPALELLNDALSEAAL
jgi:hypothetical protein